MRVLYVTQNSSLRSTTCYLNAIFRQLIPQGLEPVMLFREPGPWQRQLADQGIPCYFHSLRPLKKSAPLRSLWSLWRLTGIVKREQINLIHCNEHELFPLMRYVGAWCRCPIVTGVRFRLGSGFANWAFRAPWTPACLQFTSRDQLDASLGMLPSNITLDRVKLVMNGLDIQEFLASNVGANELRRSWDADSSKVVIGTASVIRRRKRIEDFIRLIAELRAKGLEVVGVVARGGRFADEGYPEELEELIRELNLTPHCRMLGNLDPIAPFMQAIDIFVSTSSMETFGMSVCEAMVCEKPVVAYDVGSLREVARDPWCLVPFPDHQVLCEKVARLVEDEESRRRMGEAGAAHVHANFDAPVLAARQASIYEQVLGRDLFSGPQGTAKHGTESEVAGNLIPATQ